MCALVCVCGCVRVTYCTTQDSLHSHSKIRAVPIKASCVGRQSLVPSWTRPRPPPLAVMYCTSCSLPYPGAERGRAEGGCDIKDPPRCQMGPQLNPKTPPSPRPLPTHHRTHTHNILSYKCHEDKFGVGEISALLLPPGGVLQWLIAPLAVTA